MNKSLEEGWREIKAYLDYCFGRRNICNAMKYNSTSGYLQPFIDLVETELKRLEELEKVNSINAELYTKLDIEKSKQDKILRIIKEKRVFIDYLIASDNVDEYNDYVEEQGRYDEDKLTQAEYNLLKELLK